ncbi:MAG: tRNA (guanosine(37)-N1)-methyltransferase TrmD [Fidelibacterota bacterium]
MTQIGVITPVPDVITTLVRNSILRKAVNKGLVELHVFNLRDFATGTYRQIDDTPYGGGAGMVLMAEPLFKAISACKSAMTFGKEGRVMYPSPQGPVWSQDMAQKFSQVEQLIFICGHYKGMDERVIEHCVTDEFSLGDYVISGGELAAMVMIDSMVRLLPGVLNRIDSAETDSFPTGLLDCPYYTKPRSLNGMDVPDVLLSGHHGDIEKWRQEQRETRTKNRRPDLWKRFQKIKKDSENES